MGEKASSSWLQSAMQLPRGDNAVIPGKLHCAPHLHHTARIQHLDNQHLPLAYNWKRLMNLCGPMVGKCSPMRCCEFSTSRPLMRVSRPVRASTWAYEIDKVEPGCMLVASPETFKFAGQRQVNPLREPVHCHTKVAFLLSPQHCARLSLLDSSMRML